VEGGEGRTLTSRALVSDLGTAAWPSDRSWLSPRREGVPTAVNTASASAIGGEIEPLLPCVPDDKTVEIRLE
jgi:hypothetical protein